MNKKILKAAFIAAIAMVSGMNVFNAQKSEVLSDVVLANVEALARTEGDGIKWQGFVYNWEKRCCARSLPSAECSGAYSACAE